MINWGRRAYSEEEFRKAWLTSASLRQVGKQLGQSASGRNYYSLRTAAASLGLNESHMGEQAQRIARGRRATRPLSEIMVANSDYQNTDRLRKRLISEGILPGECSAPYCPFKTSPVRDPFDGSAAQLRLCLDHIDGDNKNHSLDNLRILCYHCHAMTPTFGAKNINVV